MTDIPHHPAFVGTPAERAGRTRLWLPLACVALGATAGLTAGHAMAADAATYESTLVLLLRFMALVKGLGVLLAAAALYWRLTKPIDRRPVTAFCCALTAMAAAPGLIWSLGGVATGAVLFHAGLLGFLALAWADRGV